MSTYRSILVLLDGSEAANTALRHAASLARDQGARLTLLTVVPPMPVPPSIEVAPPPELTDLHTRIMRDAVDSIPADLAVTTRIGRGDIVKATLEVLAAEHCDLIVIGAHGHRRVHHALLGSSSERILLAVDVPVLLTRAPVEKLGSERG